MEQANLLFDEFNPTSLLYLLIRRKHLRAVSKHSQLTSLSIQPAKVTTLAQLV